MRVIKATLALALTLILALSGTLTAHSAPLSVPTHSASKAHHKTHLKIIPASQSKHYQAGWDTLDYVFNSNPKLARTLVKHGDTVQYVGTSARPVASLPLVSFRGKSVGGKITHHVFLFTKADNGHLLPAYQFNRLAKLFPACKSEDSNLCYWDARKSGNKRGNSFIALDAYTALSKR